MGKDNTLTDDHHCSVKERTHLSVELAKCDAEFEPGDVREACYDSAMEASKTRVTACKSKPG